MLLLDSDDDSGIAYGCQSEPHIADYRLGDDLIDSRMSDVQIRYAYVCVCMCVCL